MLRNVSVNDTDQMRVERSPLMSLHGETSPRGDKVFVGDSQEILVVIPSGQADIPQSFDVSLDHTPTDSLEASGLKITGNHAQGSHEVSQLAAINEFHGVYDNVDCTWTPLKVWFVGTQGCISQKRLIR